MNFEPGYLGGYLTGFIMGILAVLFFTASVVPNGKK